MMAIWVVVLLILVLAVGARADVVSLDTGALKLDFDSAGGKLALTGIRDSGGPNWIAKPSGTLWKLALVSDDGKTKEIASSDAKLASARASSGKIVAKWGAKVGSGKLTVTASVRADGGSRSSYWSLKAELPNGWKVTRADFPILPDISMDAAKKMAVPFGWGLEYDVKDGMSYEATYPSMIAAMQFVAFYGGGKALYVGTHDPQANHKVYSAKADERGVTYTCANWPGLAEKGGGTYDLPYEAAVGVVDGGWYEAAQVYREWALTAPWSKAGPVSKRPIPQWVKDTDLWLRVETPMDDMMGLCKQAKSYFDMPIALHWYRWHEIPYDTLYPDYFPPKPGFADQIKTLQSQGMHVMPYINGRIVDPNSKGWNEEGLSKSAARNEKGEPYTEVYGSKVPLNSMCPYTKAWQDKVAGLVDRLTHECGVDGVYIDQIGCAWAYRCYDKSHGHPLGGGHFWVDGYRKLLDEARAKLPEGKMLTTEENIECFIDQFDALLLVNTPCASDRQVIPLFPAVYSGRTITFGFQYIGADDAKLSMPFRAKMAREFTFGAQIGWVRVDMMMAPEAEKEREFVRNLARCRSFGHKFLLTGRLLGVMNVGGDNPRVKFTAPAPFGGEYTLDTPSVVGSAWEAEDGSIGVALANMSNEDRKVEFAAPLKAGNAYQAEVFGPEGRRPTAAGADGENVTVPARSAVVVAFSSGGR
jgi:hypothetical protein